MKTLYEQLKEAGVKVENWQSDLYCPVNEVSKKIVENSALAFTAGKFIDQIDKKLWYDIPFAFDPYYKNLRNDD